MLPALTAALALLAGAPAAAVQGVPVVRYELDIGDMRGSTGSSFARVALDREFGELVVANGTDVIVYKEGLETYRFTVDPAIGVATHAMALDNGDFLVLAANRLLYRCGFRGQLIEQVQLTGLPRALEGFGASDLAFSQGKLFLLDGPGMRVLVVRSDGRYVTSYDLGALVAKSGESVRRDHDIRGFSVDDRGFMLFTIPSSFRAFEVSPRGEVRAFGTPGSRPGRFNVVGPIVRDEWGIVYVGDLLRCVVMLFDRDFNFLVEIGGRGYGRGQLMVPAYLAVGGGWLYVSQGGGRGVSAFTVQPPALKPAAAPKPPGAG